MATEPKAAFEELRPLLFSIAYRMLSTVSDAEDILQDAFIRWEATGKEQAESPKQYLSATVTRLCIDHLQSARVRREKYVGPWLPEPLVAETAPSPAEKQELSESVSMAFLVLLESLTPAERAVYLLREVFDYGYDEVAQIVEKNEGTCRQLHHRAKQHLLERRPRFEPATDAHLHIAQSFALAVGTGDLEMLEKLLAKDVASYADGGGKATASRVPVLGRSKVAKAFLGFGRNTPRDVKLRFATVNGSPALIGYSQERPFFVNIFQVEDGQIKAIHSILNPDKLAHVPPFRR